MLFTKCKHFKIKLNGFYTTRTRPRRRTAVRPAQGDGSSRRVGTKEHWQIITPTTKLQTMKTDIRIEESGSRDGPLIRRCR
jgi:hypothetical protein